MTVRSLALIALGLASAVWTAGSRRLPADALPQGTLGAQGQKPAAADPGWLAEAQASLAQREYHASRRGEELQAPNRAQNLRAYFRPDGLRLHDRTARREPELAGLRLSAMGRPGRERQVPPGTLSSSGARVEIRRPGLVEWYVNQPQGLEQGFTLHERPAGEGALTLRLAVSGAKAVAEHGGARLRSTAGRELRYAGLQVSDARARTVPASLRVAGQNEIVIAIADAGAEYPLTVDPWITGAFETQLESDQASAALGNSVASAGDVNGDGYADVIVGAFHFDSGQTDEGAAFLFLGGPAGVASGGPAGAVAVLEGDQAGVSFGAAVASAGDVNGDGYADVVVGASNYNAGIAGEGAAFVFLGGPTGISSGSPATAHATLRGGQGGANLGARVAGAGDVDADGYADIVVGAPFYDAGETNEGAAFVFLGGPTGVSSGSSATAHATLQSDQAGANLGSGVAGAGDVNADGYADVVAGAQFYDNGQVDEGAAFVFLGGPAGIPSGTPATAAALLESDLAGAKLGVSVASAGDVDGDGYADVIVGASDYAAGESLEGAAFVFKGSPAGLVGTSPATAAATIQSNQVNALLGNSVASAGDVNGDGYADVVVGALAFDAGQADEGAAFVFLGGPSGIASGGPGAASATLQSNQAGAVLAQSVASAGDVDGDGYADLIVGAVNFDAGQLNEGAAFVFRGTSAGLSNGSPATASAALRAGQASTNLGFSVASAGDVDADGYSDVIVGASNYDAGQLNEGAAFVFLGGPAGLASATPATAAATLQSDQANGFLGVSVASAGDVNGDGFADVVVGANGYNAGQAGEGAAFVFLGGPTGVANGGPATAAATFQSDQAGALMGFRVASAGDVDGDGYSDVIVGAHLFDAGQVDEGAAFVFLGGPGGVQSGTPATAAATLQSDQAGAQLGIGLASAGDVDGDGFADIVVGAERFDAGQADEGAAFVFFGGPGGVASGGPGSAAATLQADQASALLGHSVAAAGDVNGDGYADIIVGAPAYDAGQADEGAAFVFLGGPGGVASGTPASAAAVLESDQGSSQMGQSVASAGDVNGDGHADVIVGAPLYSAGQVAEGAAFLFLGAATGVAGGTPATAAATLQADQVGATLGQSVASAGDLNGDGYADVVVGAPQHDLALTDEGAAFVFYGNGRTGRPVVARQGRGDGSATPVQSWGLAHHGSSFETRLTATHPEGARHLALETQACPAGSNWGAPACATHVSEWTNAPSGIAVLNDTLPGLDSDRLYRWRARVLYGPTALNPGVTLPARPAHGPWRRLDGQAREADIRTSSRASLGVTLSDWPDPVVAQQTLHYTLAVGNAGPDAARNVSARLTLPGSVTFASASGSGWTCTPLLGVVTCNRPSLPVGGEPIFVDVTAPASGVAGVYSFATIGSTALDANPFDDFEDELTAVLPLADLSITKADGLTSVTPGSPVTYTITVANAGPAPANGAIVNDTLPAILDSASWTCTPVAGGATCPAAGSGSISHAVNLPAGSSLAYSLTGTVHASATGVLANVATVTAPSSVADTNLLNNQASDVDQLTPTAALGMTVSNGLTTVLPGQAVTYILVASNAGPNHAYGATVADSIPPSLTAATWTCSASPGSSCPASGAGDIGHAVNLLAGGTLTYTLNATVSASATGVVSNAASIGLPAGFTDPTPGNNTAVDADPVEVDADLGVTNSDGLGTAVPGTSTTYTITVANAGPRHVVGAHVRDSLPAGLQGGAWTCSASPGSSCAASGSGSIDDTVSVLSGGTLTYSLTATVRPEATGTLTNTASASVPAGLSDPDSSNDSASDSDTLTPSTDLAVTLADSPDPAPVFGTVTYTLDASNAGPSAATDVSAALTLPAGLAFSSASAGCTHGAGTVTCAAGGLGASQSRSYTVAATANPGTRGDVTASASIAGAESDPAGANNAAATTTSVRFAKGDLENDLHTDLLLRRIATGENVVWLMNGATRRSNVLVTPDPPGLDWTVAGVDDFGADNRNDLLFWNATTGAVDFWMMGGPTGSDRQGPPVALAGALPPPWKPSATADFDHDGRPDLVYRNFATQKIVIWTLAGTTHAGTIVPDPDQAVAANWEIVGAQDWNGDGDTDFLWYNPDSGKIVLWFMDANVVRITGQFTSPANAGANNWKVLAMGDYGIGPAGLPGTIDIVWRNADSGKFVLWYMDQAGNRTAGVFTSPDSPSDPLGFTIAGPR